MFRQKIKGKDEEMCCQLNDTNKKARTKINERKECSSFIYARKNPHLFSEKLQATKYNFIKLFQQFLVQVCLLVSLMKYSIE